MCEKEKGRWLQQTMQLFAFNYQGFNPSNLMVIEPPNKQLKSNSQIYSLLLVTERTLNDSLSAPIFRLFTTIATGLSTLMLLNLIT